MTTYNATATLNTPITRIPPAMLDAILDELTGHHPAVVAGPTGEAEIIITLPADNLTQAITTANTLLTRHARHRPIGLEVIPTDLWDKRQGTAPMPELLSVTDAANRLGTTRQAVLQRIETGSIPATKVGPNWIIPAATLTHR